MEEKKPGENINNGSKKNKKVLNVLFTIVILITLFTGSIVYYQLYKYSEEEIVSNSKDETPSTVADIINTAIDSNANGNDGTVSGNGTISSLDADSRKVLNEEIIVLYDGLILDVTNMKTVDLKYIDNSKSDKEKYVITYYNYKNFEFKNYSLGTISSQVLDGLVKIDNVGKVSISESYNAIPQDIQVVNSIPAVVLENNSDFSNYDIKKSIICDLDGNATNEYIIILGNKSTGESKIVLVESTGFIKAVLATMDKSGWDSIATDGYYLSYNNIELLDVDNDGIMEILFELPTTKTIPLEVNLLKYKNGELQGTTDISCSLAG